MIRRFCDYCGDEVFEEYHDVGTARHSKNRHSLTVRKIACFDCAESGKIKIGRD